MKSLNKNLFTLGILSTCTLLYACGGGGGGDGDSSSPPATGGSTGETLQLTINGQVTDNPVSNAEIRFEVGQEVFFATADTDGFYSATIEVNETSAADMVRAVATQPGNSQLKLVSLLGSFETLDRIAGSDETLTRDESTAVNLTNISTAMAGLIEADGAISTQDQLDEAKKSLDAHIVVSLATSIKLILDYAANPAVSLPGGAFDTYTFARNFELAAIYAEKIQRENTELYKKAVNEVLADPGIVRSTVTESQGNLADTYYFTSPGSGAAVFGFDYTAENGYRLQLNSDGTGEIQGADGSSGLTWQATANGIEIANAALTKHSYVYDNNTNLQIQEDSVVSLKNIRWLDRGLDSDILLLSAEQHLSYPGGEYPDTAPQAFVSATTAIKSAGTINAEELLEIGRSYSMPLPNTLDTDTGSISLSAQAMLFSGSTDNGGTVTITLESVTPEGQPLTSESVNDWVIDNRGHLKVLDDRKLDYVFLTREEGKTPSAFVYDGSTGTAGLSHALLEEAPKWTAAEAVGIYMYALNYFYPLEPFWFEINADGTASTLFAYDSNGDGALEESEIFEQPGLWKITGSGDLLIRRYIALSDGSPCAPSTWDPVEGADCVLYHERELKLYQRAGDGRHWVRHYHRYFDDPMRDTANGDPASGHIFRFGYIDNRPFEKVTERPVAISGN